MVGDSEMGEEAAEPVIEATAKLNLTGLTHMFAASQFTRFSHWHDTPDCSTLGKKQGVCLSDFPKVPNRARNVPSRSNLHDYLSLEENHLFQLWSSS